MNRSQRKGVPRGIRLKDLVKHLCIFGMPGSGKTTAVFHILIQLGALGIPFLVIESAKTEYRMLKLLRTHLTLALARFGTALRVYSAGMESVSPFRLNPLWRPPGITADELVEMVQLSFKASMPISGPLPALLGEAVELVLDEHVNHDTPPTIADVYQACQTVIQHKTYSADFKSELLGALDVRLGTLTRRALGQMFQCHQNIPSIDTLMNSSSFLELDHLSLDGACMTAMSTLLAIRAYARTTQHSGKLPRFCVIIEEAHNIVGRNTEAMASEQNADPKAFAADLVSRMLAELRALGICIIIVDQTPSAVAASVIKNTGSKLGFRLVDYDDREVLGHAMLFGPIEFEEIARLLTGQAYLFTEGYHKPRRIVTPDVASILKLPGVLLGEAIRPHLEHDDWFIADWLVRSADELATLQRHMDEFDTKRHAAIQRIKGLLEEHVALLDAPSRDARTRAGRPREILRITATVRSQIKSQFLRLERGPYRRLLGADLALEGDDQGIRARREGLRRRFEDIVKPDTQSFLAYLDELEKRIQASPT